MIIKKINLDIEIINNYYYGVIKFKNFLICKGVIYMNYDTIILTTERLILKKGTSKDCIKIYEYDLLKCRGIAGEEILIKSKEPIDFIGKDEEKYYNDCINTKVYDWYMYLKDGTPIGNITADRQIEDINSIELAYNLHPDYWRHGYMTEALNEVINYLFKIGYDNIIIGYDTGNYKSKALAEKLNFQPYKTLKSVYKKNGISIDTTLMIMNKEKWNITKEKHKKR